MDSPIIDLQSDHHFMGEALRQAAKAYEAEEVPIGAVIVREGRIIARAFNQVELLKDATAHAEMLAITQAEEAVGDWRLTDCTLYVTKEPCPMCAGAMVHVRFARVVFGALDPKAAQRKHGESSAMAHVEPQVPDHFRRARGGVPRIAAKFFSGAARERAVAGGVVPNYCLAIELPLSQICAVNLLKFILFSIGLLSPVVAKQTRWTTGYVAAFRLQTNLRIFTGVRSQISLDLSPLLHSVMVFSWLAVATSAKAVMGTCPLPYAFPQMDCRGPKSARLRLGLMACPLSLTAMDSSCTQRVSGFPRLAHTFPPMPLTGLRLSTISTMPTMSFMEMADGWQEIIFRRTFTPPLIRLLKIHGLRFCRLHYLNRFEHWLMEMVLLLQ
jgi:tRNA(Arg) A34 adenosine deaminase TadA